MISNTKESRPRGDSAEGARESDFLRERSERERERDRLPKLPSIPKIDRDPASCASGRRECVHECVSIVRGTLSGYREASRDTCVTVTLIEIILFYPSTITPAIIGDSVALSSAFRFYTRETLRTRASERAGVYRSDVFLPGSRTVSGFFRRDTSLTSEKKKEEQKEGGEKVWRRAGDGVSAKRNDGIGSCDVTRRVFVAMDARRGTRRMDRRTGSRAIDSRARRSSPVAVV